MNTRWILSSRTTSMVVGLLLFLDGPRMMMAAPTRAAVDAFDSYCRKVEARLAEEHRSDGSFLLIAEGDQARLRGGEIVIEKMPGEEDLSGAMLHDWRGTAFAPGATAADFERLMRDFEAYPQHFSPQVLEAKTIARDGNYSQTWMRVRQRHVITVVMDSRYDITYGQMDVRHGYSISRSTEIDEIEGAGTASEHVLSASEEHGFLWRLNTYWSYEERNGGLYLQVEAVSLTRSVPRGLGWAVGPYVESVPRESLEFTLRSAVNAVRR